MRRVHPILAAIGFGLILILCVNPLGTTAAADCSALEQRVKDLQKKRDDIQNELDAALRRLGDAQKDMGDLAQKITDTEDKLKDEPAKVKQELEDKGFHDALHTLASQLGIALFLAFVAPEFELHTVLEVAEIADKALTIYEVHELLDKAAEADAVLQELAKDLGGSDALDQFAADNHLTELTNLLNQEAYLAQLQKDFAKAYSRWENAAADVIEYDAELEQAKKDLQAAMDELYACLGLPTGNPCASQETNPSGGHGVCR